MTRINIGIPPAHLCDQHLIAEYRELPRMAAFSSKVKTIPNVDFTLNTGHMKSCVRYGAHLADRHQEIVAEMRHRGFQANRSPVSVDDFSRRALYYPTQAWLALAARVV